MANRSEQINELLTALAKAQGSIKAAVKDSINPHLKNSYADLASVWDACREHLSANGLAVIQDPSFDGEIVQVVTTLGHTSGQWWESTLRATPAQTTLQQIGAAITYLRRYALSSVVGIAPDDDDDANQASNTAQRFSAATEAPRDDFKPNQLAEALDAIAAFRSTKECDAAGKAFNQIKWPRESERKQAREAFQAKRAELAKAERAAAQQVEAKLATGGACHACDIVDGHAAGCPEGPKNTPAPVAS